jgi:UDP-N-acetylmuramoyl-tripeptide--D-alanyl-D-alanine ligase
MVNNAQREHQEFMHTVEAVARENGAVLSACRRRRGRVPGRRVHAIWEELAAGRRMLRFGLTKGRSELQLPRQRFRQRDVHHRLRSEADPRQFFVRLQAAGEHNVRNALAAVACTYAAGVPLEKSNWDSIPSRRSAACSASSRNGAVVIDDTYNANPDSVRAAIDVLAKPPRRACWCWAIWAKSAASAASSTKSRRLCAGQRHRTVLVTGELAAHMHGANIRHFENFGDLLSAVDAASPDATVLIKGSRFMKMERVVQHLIGSQQANKEGH